MESILRVFLCVTITRDILRQSRVEGWTFHRWSFVIPSNPAKSQEYTNNNRCAHARNLPWKNRHWSGKISTQLSVWVRSFARLKGESRALGCRRLGCVNKKEFLFFFVLLPDATGKLWKSRWKSDRKTWKFLSRHFPSRRKCSENQLSAATLKTKTDAVQKFTN